jgi:hypothetical protein
MSKLNFSQVFTLIVGAITTVFGIFLIGKVILGMNVSVYEINLMCILTLINSVNLFHNTK